MDRSAMIERKQNRPAVEGVAAVDRALAILAAFRRGDTSLSLAELSERTGLVKSTIMRLAVSLERYGLLVRLHDGSYQLDAEVLRLGVAYQQSFRLEKFVLPALEDFVARYSETTSFYVRRGEQRQCLFRVKSPHLLRLHIHQGDMLPMDFFRNRPGSPDLWHAAYPGLCGDHRIASPNHRRDRPGYRFTRDAGIRCWRDVGRCADGRRTLNEAHAGACGDYCGSYESSSDRSDEGIGRLPARHGTRQAKSGHFMWS